MHLLVPMSGQGTRFRAAGYDCPKPMVDVCGEPMIARVLAQYPTHWPAHFVIADNHQQSALPATLAALRPNARTSVVPRHGEGPARAIEAALEGIPANAPVLVSYCDFGLVWDAEAFARMAQDSRCDAALVTYRGFQPHYFGQTPYAYARLEGDCVREVREKGHFGPDRQREHASAGAYYFRTRRLLEDALAHQRRLDLRVNGELYTSLTVEALLQLEPHAYVRAYEAAAFFQWGTPGDLEAYRYWRQTYAAAMRAAPAASAGAGAGAGYGIAQLAMPMAGGGTRFAGRTATPKPLIAVDDRPMFLAAAASLPRAERRAAFVVRASEREAVAAAVRQLPGPPPDLISLPTTPAGQALSTREALAALDEDAEVLVSACDHAIVLDAARWRAFRAAPGCDAAIFTVRGYPGAARRPEAFAYVRPHEGDAFAPFPRVAEVRVKTPLSARPQDDALLVGTFWFRTAALLREAIAAVVEGDVRVNGELYLDSALALLMDRGRVVRMLPLDGYINWGAPDAMDEALYWRQACCGLGTLEEA